MSSHALVPSWSSFSHRFILDKSATPGKPYARVGKTMKEKVNHIITPTDVLRTRRVGAFLKRLLCCFNDEELQQQQQPPRFQPSPYFPPPSPQPQYQAQPQPQPDVLSIADINNNRLSNEMLSPYLRERQTMVIGSSVQKKTYRNQANERRRKAELLKAIELVGGIHRIAREVGAIVKEPAIPSNTLTQPAIPTTTPAPAPPIPHIGATVQMMVGKGRPDSFNNKVKHQSRDAPSTTTTTTTTTAFTATLPAPGIGATVQMMVGKGRPDSVNHKVKHQAREVRGAQLREEQIASKFVPHSKESQADEAASMEQHQLMQDELEYSGSSEYDPPFPDEQYTPAESALESFNRLIQYYRQKDVLDYNDRQIAKGRNVLKPAWMMSERMQDIWYTTTVVVA